MMAARDFRLGEWVVQPSLNRISRGSESASLQPRFMDLLVYLAQNSGKVVSKDEILEAVWAKEFVSEGTLTHAIAVIRQTLGDNVRQPQYIETIPTRGYRLIAAVTPPDDIAQAGLASPAAEPQRGGWRRRAIPIAVVVAAVVLGVTVFRLVAAFTPRSAGTKAVRIAVLPFQHVGPAARDYVASGITDDITTRLAAAHGLGVISRKSAAYLANSGKTVRQIGDELGVEYLLEGTVHSEVSEGQRDHVRVNAQLISVHEDTHVWADTYPSALANIFEVSAAISRRVIQELGVRVVAPERLRLAAQPSSDLDAYQAYLCGLRYRDLENREQLGLAVAMFERAVKLDPSFALAFAELSIAHSRIYQLRFDPTPERLGQAKAAAEHALALQPNLPEGRMALGAYFYLGRRDYQRALEEFNVAARDLPNDSNLLALIADVHRRQGRWSEARVEMERVLSLDPRDFGAALSLGDTLLPLREYEEADRAFRRATNLMPDSVHPYVRRFWNFLYWDGTTDRAAKVLDDLPVPHDPDAVSCRFFLKYYERDYQRALDALSSAPPELTAESFWLAPRSLLECLCYDAMGDRARMRESCGAALGVLEEQARQRPADSRVQVGLGYAYSLLARREDAARAAERAVSLCPLAQDAYDGPFFLLEQARVSARAGDTGKALGNIEQLLAIPGFLSVPWLRLDPWFDSLRKQEQFQSLLARSPGPPGR